MQVLYAYLGCYVSLVYYTYLQSHVFSHILIGLGDYLQYTLPVALPNLCLLSLLYAHTYLPSVPCVNIATHQPI